MVADSILEANGKTKRDYIIEFIIRHDGCTQTAIIDYMAQAKHAVEKSPIHAASETTRAILRKLKSETDDKGNSILTIIKDPKNSQMSRFRTRTRTRIRTRIRTKHSFTYQRLKQFVYSSF